MAHAYPSTDQCWRCNRYFPLDRLSRLWSWFTDDDAQFFIGVYCQRCGDIEHADLMAQHACDTIVWKAF